jgi:preprotein translocase subunit SecD
LTLAVAVDANVLIYERIREELDTGKTLRSAIDAGYEKAFSAIFDSNLTTFITGLILYQFGTGPVQGFALTLMIGIVASMFTAIYITRVCFEVLTEKGTAVSFG